MLRWRTRDLELTERTEIRWHGTLTVEWPIWEYSNMSCNKTIPQILSIVIFWEVSSDWLMISSFKTFNSSHTLQILFGFLFFYHRFCFCVFCFFLLNYHRFCFYSWMKIAFDTALSWKWKKIHYHVGFLPLFLCWFSLDQREKHSTLLMTSQCEIFLYLFQTVW